MGFSKQGYCSGVPRLAELPQGPSDRTFWATDLEESLTWAPSAPCLLPSTQVDKCRPALLPATSQRPRRPGCPDAGPRLGSSAAAEPEGAGFIEMRPATRSRARPSGVRCLGWPDEQMTFVLHAPPPSQLENISIRSQPQRCRSGGFPAQERPSPVAGGQMSC